jgi:quercetin dioxygenase-like cupin family protein
MRTILPALAASLLLLPASPVPADGEAYSKAVSAKTLLRAARTAAGAPLDFPDEGSAEVVAVEVRIPAGTSTGWHVHDHAGFAYVLEGKLKVQLSDSSSREFSPGEAFAEVANTSHNGTALAKDVKLIAFFLVDSGKPVSRKTPPAP